MVLLDRFMIVFQGEYWARMELSSALPRVLRVFPYLRLVKAAFMFINVRFKNGIQQMDKTECEFITFFSIFSFKPSVTTIRIKIVTNV